MFLDEVVFEQQRLLLGTGHDVTLMHLRHQRLRLRMVRLAAEVGGDTLLEVPRLADVEHPALPVEHAVDARPVRQGTEGDRRIEGFVRHQADYRAGDRPPSAASGPRRSRIRAKTSRNIAAVRRRVWVL